MSKANWDISKQMQGDLIKAYNQVAPKCWTQQQAYERMVKQPAPRYYVTPKQAFQVIAPMVKGNFDRVNLMLPMKRRMYYALFKEVMKMSEERSFVDKPLWYIMKFAVSRPAPEFFITPRRAKQIRCWMKLNYYDEDGRLDISKQPCFIRNLEKTYERCRKRYKKEQC